MPWKGREIAIPRNFLGYTKNTSTGVEVSLAIRRARRGWSNLGQLESALTEPRHVLGGRIIYMVTGRQIFLFVHERGARSLPVSTIATTTACWLAGNRLRYFLAAILSLRGKLGCAVWKLLEWRWTNFLCWLPVIIIVSMMTFSHHNSPCWSNICADCQSSYRFHMITSSRHNKRNRGNPMRGANRRAVASGNYSHSIHADWKSSGSSLMTCTGHAHFPGTERTV